MEQLRLFTSLCFVGALLSACGVGQSNLNLPNERPRGVIQGNALGGFYSGGSISAYTFQEESKRQFIASTNIQTDGTFALELSTRSQPLLIEVTGGSYFDPSSFQTIEPEPGFVLSATLMYQSGETFDAHITPLTHLNTGLLLHSQKTSDKPMDESLFTQVNQKFDNLYSINSSNPSLSYSYQESEKTISMAGNEKLGLLINALSQIAFDERSSKDSALKENYNLSSLTAILYEDIYSDGMLDGKAIFIDDGGIKPLAFGDTVIDGNFYRLTTAFAIRKTLGYTALSTYSSKADLETYMLSIARTESELLPTINDDALRESTPHIQLQTSLELANKGDIKLDFLVQNAFNLADAKLTLGSLTFEFNLTEIFNYPDSSLSLYINSENFSDGEHQLNLIVTDTFNNVGNFQTPITFDNSPPTLTIRSASLTNESEFLIKGVYQDAFSKVASILIDGEEVAFNPDTGWEKSVTLNDGQNEFIIHIEDELGNNAQTTARVLFDNSVPIITLSSATLTNTSQFLLEGEFIEGESGISKITVNDNPASLDDNHKWSKLVALNKGDNTFVIGVEDGAGNFSEFSTTIFLDDLPPIVSVSSAALTNTSEFTLSGSYEETTPGPNKILVNGNPVELMDEQSWSIVVNLISGKNKFLISMEDEAGNLTAFQTNVVLDLLAPVISLTSGGLSNSSQFFLRGDYVDTESQVNKITANDIIATLLDDTTWEIPVELNAGNNEFIISTEDAAGNKSEFTTAVFLDVVPPTITSTAANLTNVVQYLLQGEYTENESGVRSIRVNNIEASILAEKKWSLVVSLQAGSNDFVIGIEDKAGNYTEINKTISLDNLAPEISYLNPVNTRFSNSDGTYFIGSLALTNDAPLFIEIHQLSLLEMQVSKENLDILNIPYLSFGIMDPPLDGLETAPSALRIDYRYSVNDLDIIPWQLISLDLASNEILLPLTTKTFSNAWYKFTPDDTHKLEIRVSDGPGNTTIETATFKFQFYVPELTPQPINTSPEERPAFNTRASYINNEIPVTVYNIHNSLERAFNIRFSDDATHLVTQEYEEVRRENKVQLRSTETWQKAQIIGLEGPGCPQFDENSWQLTDHLFNWVGGQWEEIFPQILGLEIKDVLTDTPTPQPADEWTKYLANDIENNLFNSTLGDETLTYNFDYLTDLNTLGPHAAFRQPGLVKGWQLTLSDGQVIPTDGPCPEINAVQTRTDYSYLPVDDFPKNNIETKSVSNTFSTSKFVVLDQDTTAIEAENGWYAVSPNRTITITKYVKTPALELHDDATVSNPSEISDYNLYTLDKKHTWQMDQSLIVETQFNPGLNLDNLTSIRKQTVLETLKTIEFVRD